MSNLFETRPLDPMPKSGKPPKTVRMIVAKGGSSQTKYMVPGDLLSGLCIPADDEYYHLVSAGAFNSSMLFRRMAEQMAVPIMHLSTWGLTDPGVRAVDMMIRDHIVSDVYALVDPHPATKMKGAMEYLRNIATRTIVVPIHAKICILRSSDCAVTMVMSANLTRNPHIEAYVVTSDRAVADFHSGWMTKLLEDHDG